MAKRERAVQFGIRVYDEDRTPSLPPSFGRQFPFFSEKKIKISAFGNRTERGSFMEETRKSSGYRYRLLPYFLVPSCLRVRWGTKSTIAIRLELVAQADSEQVRSTPILKTLCIEIIQINEARH